MGGTVGAVSEGKISTIDEALGLGASQGNQGGGKGKTLDPKARALKSLKKKGGAVSKGFKRASGQTGKKKQAEEKKKREAERKKELKRLQDEMGSLFGRDTKSSKEVRKAIGKIKGVSTADEQKRLRELAQAVETGDGSAIAQSQIKSQEAQEAIRREQAGIEAQRQGASAFANLAQTGGAGAGSRERLLQGTGAQSLRQQQQLRREGALAQLGIRAEDAQRAERARGKASDLDILSQQSASDAAARRSGLLQGQQAFETAGQAKALGFGAGAFGAEQLAQAQSQFAKNLPSGGPLQGFDTGTKLIQSTFQGLASGNNPI